MSLTNLYGDPSLCPSSMNDNIHNTITTPSFKVIDFKLVIDSLISGKNQIIFSKFYVTGKIQYQTSSTDSSYKR